MTRATLLCAALILGACSNDFDAFSFEGEGPSGTDDGSVASGDAATRGDGGSAGSGASGGGGSSGDGGASGTGGAGGDGGGDVGTDAQVPGDAATTADSGAMTDAGATTDAGTTTDAGPTDSGAAGDDGGTMPDTGPPLDPTECLTAIAPVTPTGKDSCDGCACGVCLARTAACVASGNASEDALCAAVLTCAFANACQSWDCYCSAPNCGGGSANGDGPCVAEMNAAAGGQKSQVFAIWSGSDTTEPLRRALNALDCTVGLHARSPDGPTTGMCTAECM